jgi:hypothetical protein
MKNSNDINIKQNTEEILLYLFAQRKLYSLSKKSLTIMFCVNFIFYALGLSNAIQSNNCFKAVYVIWGITFCILYIKESDRINTAATMQELIDRKLYGIDTNAPYLKETRLHQTALELKSKFQKDFIEQTSSSGKENGVKDWYSDVSGIPIENAIILCQIENSEWDTQLRMKFQKLNILLLVILLSVYIFIFWNNSVETLIINLYPILAIISDRISYIYKNHKSIKSSKEMNDYLYYLYENIGEYIKEDIINIAKEIQHCIYERRKSFAPIPDILYKLNRKKYQSFSNYYILDLKKKLQK